MASSVRWLYGYWLYTRNFLGYHQFLPDSQHNLCIHPAVIGFPPSVIAKRQPAIGRRHRIAFAAGATKGRPSRRGSFLSGPFRQYSACSFKGLSHLAKLSVNYRVTSYFHSAFWPRRFDLVPTHPLNWPLKYRMAWLVIYWYEKGFSSLLVE